MEVSCFAKFLAAIGICLPYTIIRKALFIFIFPSIYCAQKNEEIDEDGDFVIPEETEEEEFLREQKVRRRLKPSLTAQRHPGLRIEEHESQPESVVVHLGGDVVLLDCDVGESSSDPTGIFA
jgi:hypothetical protein